MATDFGGGTGARLGANCNTVATSYFSLTLQVAGGSYLPMIHSRSTPIKELAFVLAFYQAPAMAGDLSQPKGVANHKAPMHHFDESIPLKLEKAVRDACAAYSEKLSQHLVRERDLVRFQGIASEQEPSPKTLL